MLLVNVNHHLETKQLCISLHIFNWRVSISIIQCDQTHVHPITNLLDFAGFMTSPTWNLQRHKIAEATLAASRPRSSCTEGTLSDLSLLDHQCCLDADALLHGEQVSGWSGPSHSAVHSWSCLPTFGSAWDVPKDRKIKLFPKGSPSGAFTIFTNGNKHSLNKPRQLLRNGFVKSQQQYLVVGPPPTPLAQ